MGQPCAHLWQHLGLGSLAYVFCLDLIRWLLIWPLRPFRWANCSVLLSVALTSPPAPHYAIPVECFLPLATAQLLNVAFLATVTFWRVALLVVFLRRVGRLGRLAVAVAALLPIVLLVLNVATLNLEHVFFELMAGSRDQGPRGTAEPMESCC